jgi:hypothetical protein
MVLADAMGVVMGTSHHEPMTRAQAEWHRNKEQGVTGGKWDFAKNGDNLRKFWRGGIERMMSKGDGHGYECLVTVGMRGDGDEPMSEGTATQLLESIVAAQRDIIRDVTGKPAELQPQVWALYKEVQDYYDHGMKVPDDVTLLFAGRQLGPGASPAHRRPGSPGRLRRVLPLRLRRRSAQLQVAEHQPDREDLAADGSHLPARREGVVDRQRRRHQADGVPAELLHGPGLGPGGHDTRSDD